MRKTIIMAFMALFFSCKPSPKGNQAGLEVTSDTLDMISTLQGGVQRVKDDSLNVSNTMKAPDIKPNNDGFITLNMCPRTCQYLSVVINEEGTKATLFRDGKEIQVIFDEDGLASQMSPTDVHFLDANFDGYIDIYLGKGEERTINTLLLWNASKGEFQRLTLSPARFMLHVPSKSVVQGGDGSFCSYYISRDIWNGMTLQTLETLIIISDDKYFEEYDVRAHYTLYDRQDNIIFESYVPYLFSQEWQSFLKAFSAYKIYPKKITINKLKMYCHDNPHQAKQKLQGLYAIEGYISSVSEDGLSFHIESENHFDFFSIHCKLEKNSSVVDYSHNGDRIKVIGKFENFYTISVDLKVTEVEALE